MPVSLALGWAAAACVVLLHLPQIWRTVVHGRTAGVPASRAWVVIAVSVVWLGYGLYGGGVVQIVLNAVVVVLNGALLVRLVTTRRQAALGTVLAMVGAAAVLVIGELFGRAPLGIVGAVSGSVLYLPQLLALMRTHQVDGVSPASLWLQALSGCCWIGYGALRAESVVWLPNVGVLIVTVWTLAVLRERRTAWQAQRPKAKSGGMAWHRDTSIG